MFTKIRDLASPLPLMAAMAALGGMLFAPVVRSQETIFQESVQSQTTFAAQQCSVKLTDPSEEMAMDCNQLSITEGDGTINFHYDDGDVMGFSFVLEYNDDPILVNGKINNNQYNVIGTFLWTAEDGIVDETLTEATGNCRATPAQVVCQATIDNTMKVEAVVDF
ncbi:hypothetical protein [Synechocystis sp. CACIAM 05]|jgi:hypothetical protein|uniref:hypothetical protein n=1 Tax=Synechocystis sp. CACIAM 05 TaxID=1933929 RepID=UPI00138E5E43|nr:hypothetical protein [Synechocystis sp. CACIAM 05]QHV00534.1 hypothetical protein BWK47_10630 [Synechocystis sp. CACIAM 05]